MQNDTITIEGISMFDEITEDFCPMQKWIGIPGYTLDDCPDYGSSSCPITMDEDDPCEMPLEDLEEILSYKWR